MTDEHKRPASSTIAVVLLWLQGVYFAVFGVWPLISIRTFKLVTGEKTDHLVTGLEADHWLVMTVGLLITSIGLVLILAAGVVANLWKSCSSRWRVRSVWPQSTSST